MDSKVSGLIPRIYDAVGQPESWNNILDEISDAFDLVGINLFCGDSVQADATKGWVSTRALPVFADWMGSDASKIDAQLYNLIPAYLPEKKLSSLNQFRQLCVDAGEVWPDDYHTVDQWLQNKLGTVERYCSPLNVRPGYWDFITLHLGSSPAGAHHLIESANLLLPHIARATDLNRPFVLLEARFNAILSVLDKFYLAVFILDARLNIVVRNVAAQKMLAHADTLILDAAKRLKMLAPEDQKFLQTAMTASSSPEQVGARSYRQALSRTGTKMPYFAELSLISDVVVGESGPHWALIVVDPEEKEIVDTEGITSVFDLTNSEKHVIRSLVGGSKVDEIAEARNVSPETVKYHTKSIYSKLNCHSRAELINLAHQISLPVSPKPPES